MKKFFIVLTGIAMSLIGMVLTIGSAAEPEELTIVSNKK